MTVTEGRAAMSTASISDAREVLSVTQAERDKAKKAGNSLPDGSYPINNVAQLHAAAVLAASHHGDWKAAQALIRRRAKELGVDVTTLPGFGGSTAQDRSAFELRKRHRGRMAGFRERRNLPFTRGDIEMRAKPSGTGGTVYEFRGFGATFWPDEFEIYDKWGEPFLENLATTGVDRTLREKPDTRFFVGHNESDLALARTAHGNHPGTMTLSKHTRGLEAYVPSLDGRSSRVMDLVVAIERGDMDQMSIGFVTRGQEWSADYERRTLTDIDLNNGDVSVVAIPANPRTSASVAAVPVSDALSRRWEGEKLSRQAAERRAAMNAAAATDTHDHPHFHQDDADHDHDHDTHGDGDNDADDRASRRPREHRGNPVDQDLGDSSDYDVYTGPLPHPPMTGMHAHEHPSYGGDALVRINDDGVPAMEEQQGAIASLAAARALLETRRRQLDLLRRQG